MLKFSTFVSVIILVISMALILTIALRYKRKSYCALESSFWATLERDFWKITRKFSSPSDDYFLYGLHSNHSNFSISTDLLGLTEFINTTNEFVMYNRTFDRFTISEAGEVHFMMGKWKTGNYYLSLSPFSISKEVRRKGKIHYGEIRDERMIKAIDADVREICNCDRFNATWVYIITWYDCRPVFSNAAESNYSNTFQLIMTFNGIDFYAMFNFVRLQWPNNVVNFTFSSKVTLHHRFNQTILFENETVANLLEKSNMNRPSRWFLNFNNSNCSFT